MELNDLFASSTNLYFWGGLFADRLESFVHFMCKSFFFFWISLLRIPYLLLMKNSLKWDDIINCFVIFSQCSFRQVSPITILSGLFFQYYLLKFVFNLTCKKLETLQSYCTGKKAAVFWWFFYFYFIFKTVFSES